MTFLALLVDNIDQSVTSSDFTHFFLFSGIVWIRLLLVEDCFPSKQKEAKNISHMWNG